MTHGIGHTHYKLRIYDHSSSDVAELYDDSAATGFLRLGYERIKNDVGLIHFQVNFEHRIRPFLKVNNVVEVYRSRREGGWDLETTGIIRRVRNEGDVQAITNVWAPELNYLLTARTVQWPANVTDRSKFNRHIPDIARLIVATNLGDQATEANERLVEGVHPWVSVESLTAAGTQHIWYCFQRLLLDTLHDLAELEGNAFLFHPVAWNDWEFRWLALLGEDKRDTLLFSIPLGNMKDPVYELNALDELTAVVAGGQGENTERDFVKVTNAQHTGLSRRDAFVSAPDVDYGDLNALETRAAVALSEAEGVESFGFTGINTALTNYRVHYDLGDLVTAQNPFTGDLVPCEIAAVSVTLEPGRAGEQIRSMIREWRYG
jgi:hypothetical protein